MSQSEIEQMEADAMLIDLDDVAGDMPVCMMAPECTDSSSSHSGGSDLC